jgi:hypothetical protein
MLIELADTSVALVVGGTGCLAELVEGDGSECELHDAPRPTGASVLPIEPDAPPKPSSSRGWGSLFDVFKTRR